MENQLKLNVILELFGHQRIAGVLTEQQIGGASFIRIDVPEIPEQAAYSRMLNPSAIYAINPVTEEVMLATATALKSKPIESWDAREMIKRIDIIRAKELQSGNNDELPFDVDDL